MVGGKFWEVSTVTSVYTTLVCTSHAMTAAAWQQPQTAEGRMRSSHHANMTSITFLCLWLLNLM